MALALALRARVGTACGYPNETTQRKNKARRGVLLETRNKEKQRRSNPDIKTPVLAGTLRSPILPPIAVTAGAKQLESKQAPHSGLWGSVFDSHILNSDHTTPAWGIQGDTALAWTLGGSNTQPGHCCDRVGM